MDECTSAWRDVRLAGYIGMVKGVRRDAKEGVRDRAGPGLGQGWNVGIGNDVMARYDSYD